MGVDPELVREELSRLLGSETFRRSAQLSNFLRFVVERTLEGRSEEIKEYAIGVEAYGRPETFDPRIDPTVRTEARRLRAKLGSYYETEGKDDPVRIVLQTGSYVPTFVAVAATPSSASLRPTLVVALGAASVMVAGFLVWTSRLERGQERKPRVAVLPFEARDADDESIALAMGESLVTQLSAMDGIEVASRSATWRFSRIVTAREDLAAILAADYLVDGTVERNGDGFRVSAELVSVDDGSPLWQDSRNFSWSSVFEAQDEIAGAVALQLAPRADSSAGGAHATTAEAYESYVKGRFSAVQFNNTRQSVFFEEAERRLSTATTLDPELADAWTELGQLYLWRLYPPVAGREDILATARSHLERALAVDPRHSTALHVLCGVEAESGRPETGVELCRESIEIDPESGEAHGRLGNIYASLGFYESALVEYERAIALDPLDVSPFAMNSRALARLGRFEEALAMIERTLDLAPGSPTVRLLLGDVHYRKGDLARAETVWRNAHSEVDESSEKDFLGIALALVAAERGDEETARRALADNEGEPYRELTHLTEIAAILGDADYVVERVRDHPQRSYRWLVEEPKLTTLAAAPEFQELLRSRYERWMSNLERLAGTLPAPPPPLPTADEYLARGRSFPAMTGPEAP